MPDPTRAMLQRQRQRLVASLMGYAERNVFWGMRPDEQRAYRAKVLQSVDSYHDFMLDLAKVFEEQNPDVNQEAIRLIRELHDHLLGERV